MADLTKFTLDDLDRIRNGIQAVATRATSMAAGAAAITGHLHRELRDASGAPACASVRLFVTQRFEELPTDLAALATSIAPAAGPGTTCLVLLASNGDLELPEGSLPEERVLPFTESVLEEIPLMPRLLEQVGLDLETALDPARAVEVRLQHRTFNVFLAAGLGDDEVLLPNPVHRQLFRERGIKSLVVLAGVLPTGSILLIIVQACVEVSVDTADLLQVLGVSVKAALTPVSYKVFPPA